MNVEETNACHSSLHCIEAYVYGATVLALYLIKRIARIEAYVKEQYHRHVWTSISEGNEHRHSPTAARQKVIE